MIKKIFNLIIDFLYPKTCLDCGRHGTFLCAECFSKRQLNSVDRCHVCQQPSPLSATHLGCKKKTNLDGLIVASPHNDKVVHDMIYKFKYYFVRELGDPLGMLLVKKLQLILNEASERGKFENWLKTSTLIPIPLYKKRLRWRGYNQAEILASQVSQFFGVQKESNILKRIKHAKPQQKLKRKQRLKNLNNAFEVNANLKNKLKNESVILVDDVTTTQTSLNECAHVLKKAGAKSVWGLVLSRG